MELDRETGSEAREEEGGQVKIANGKPIVVIMVGAPGSGKSTFCDHVIRVSSRPWVRICQDTIGNGKAGTKIECIKNAVNALKEGKSVFIDRCNIDREQRGDFLNIGSPQVEKHAVVLDLPAKLCISRSVKRTGHEGNLQGGKAAAVVNRMLQKKELPKLSEGFTRITFCHNEKDVEAAVNTYSVLGPLDILPSGCFGQKSLDAKVQVGIMKFLKKLDNPGKDGLAESNTQHSSHNQITAEKDSSPRRLGNDSAPCEHDHKDMKDSASQETGCSSGTISYSIPTLAFPSISTADFQFNLEKASDIIVEKVEEFVNKLGNARLVLVDLSHGSKILSLVKAKAEKKNIDSKKFFTFVGDITQLYSQGGLQCNVIANAANWRLKPGGGGVNAAIFGAAGPGLESATKERAGSLAPGKALVVPLPSTSPLSIKEGITHVIHVLGPNMNPQRPNCLNNDYLKGCKVLREAYSSLFEGFASVLSAQGWLSKESNEMSLNKQDEHERNHSYSGDQKVKREALIECEGSKKSKVFLEEVRPSFSHCVDGKSSVKSSDDVEHLNECERNKNSKDYLKERRPSVSHSLDRKGNLDSRVDTDMNKAWGPWAQALYQIAMHPNKHKNDVREILDDVVVLDDLYPKARKHLLVLSRVEGLDRLADVRKEHLPLLRTMHAVALKWGENFLNENEALVFRLGYHSEPSMRQLHLHVISQDFDSKHLKNKKHWNSFNTPFFRDSVDVLEEVSKDGKATVRDDDSFHSMELRCHRCRSAHPNIPRLKTHISSCQAPFPRVLCENGRLVFGPGKGG